MVPPASHRVSRVRRYSGSSLAYIGFRLRGSHPLWPAFPYRSAKLPRRCVSPQPRRINPPVCPLPRSLATTCGISVDVSSSPYLDVSVQAVPFLRLFCSTQDDWILSSRVAPFGNLRINGYLLLPEAYRSLSRPSSAPDAKAFPLRSFQLDLSPFSQRLVREFLVLFENYAGLQRSKLYVTLHPFECCSTINLLRRVSPHNASLLPYLLCHIVQFSRCRSPTAFAVRFEDPIFRSGLQIQRQIAWWARVGSNHRPYDYQSYALAS